MLPSVMFVTALAYVDNMRLTPMATCTFMWMAFMIQAIKAGGPILIMRATSPSEIRWLMTNSYYNTNIYPNLLYCRQEPIRRLVVCAGW